MVGRGLGDLGGWPGQAQGVGQAQELKKMVPLNFQFIPYFFPSLELSDAFKVIYPVILNRDFSINRKEVKVMEEAFAKENLCLLIRRFMSSWMPHVFLIQSS